MEGYFAGPVFSVPADAVTLWDGALDGPPVFCATCRQKFKEVVGATQAYGCASDVFVDAKSGARLILSHYGSIFDTDRHVVSSQSLLKDGIVCDECIAYEVLAHRAIRDRKFNYFEYAGWNNC